MPNKVKIIIVFGLFSVLVLAKTSLSDVTFKKTQGGTVIEIYFKDGYLKQDTCEILFDIRPVGTTPAYDSITKTPIRKSSREPSWQPTITIKFSSSQGGDQYRLCGRGALNDCIRYDRIEKVFWGNACGVFPRMFGKLSKFYEGGGPNEEYGIFEIYDESSGTTLTRVPYRVVRQGQDGFITFGQSTVSEQMTPAPSPPTSPPPSLPAQTYTPDQRLFGDDFPSNPPSKPGRDAYEWFLKAFDPPVKMRWVGTDEGQIGKEGDLMRYFVSTDLGKTPRKWASGAKRRECQAIVILSVFESNLLSGSQKLQHLFTRNTIFT